MRTFMPSAEAQAVLLQQRAQAHAGVGEERDAEDGLAAPACRRPA